MILGISSGLAHDGAKEWASKQKELGCGAVVFPIDYRAGRQEIRDYAEAAADANLVIAEVGVWRNLIAVNEKEREEAHEYAVGQLAMADEIHANCCVNIAGASSGDRWDGASADNFSDEAWHKTVESIQKVVDDVKPRNTKYAIETMPWMIPTGPDEYLKLLCDVNRTEVGVHIDIVNMINCPERYFFQRKFMDECFEKLAGKILSCHLKDISLRQEYTFQLRETSCGDGNLDLDYYVELATKENKMMPMIIEHLNSDEEYINCVRYVQKRLGNRD